MPIKINKLESARFGIVVANVVDNESKLSEINISAKKQNVNLLTQRINVGNLTLFHSLEEDGYRLMDTLVCYQRRISKPPTTVVPIDDVKYRFANQDDTMAVADLARGAFQSYFGHYHADTRLDNGAADAVYIDWATKSTAGVSVKAPVLLAEFGKEIVGFITFEHYSSRKKTKLLLSAVHTDFQGHGLYKALVAATFNHAQTAGTSLLSVSTQINNYAVQGVWAQLGFVHVSSLYTMHKWY